ncbi:hypothetical protein ACLK17_05000 [Escherichia coli]
MDSENLMFSLFKNQLVNGDE